MSNNLSKHNEKNDYEKKIKSYSQKIHENGVPLIFDSEHLRRIIGVNKKSFLEIINSIDIQYHTIYVPKKREGFREINKPSINLMIIQRWILENILYKKKVHNNSFGFEPKKSVISNAKEHLNKKTVLSVDIEDFFHSIKEDYIKKIFLDMGYTKKLSELLAKICCFNGMLPQGSPSSPYLSNIYCIELDKDIYKLCQNYDLKYSRYADDITISSNNHINSEEVITNLIKIFNKYGFEMNSSKTRVSLKGNRQIVTGILVNDKLNVSKKYRNDLRQEIYYLNKYGLENHLDKRDDIMRRSNYKEYIYGKVNYLKLFDIEKANNYYEVLNRIDW
ncbi:RNA-directed DNA polymerase [Carnobacterium sp. CS13]|uniref:reverse transcriptase family protein n=1 Tax=Carnobacterium sp. CS13 TaxID=2800128 RepID=UPI0019128873|nr:reverse transcriptase family protein [Carnobacterium sp. CS13]QQP70185.1 RNA-directed DNA polymerase [Carnobacterium sp. CS13]